MGIRAPADFCICDEKESFLTPKKISVDGDFSKSDTISTEAKGMGVLSGFITSTLPKACLGNLAGLF